MSTLHDRLAIDVGHVGHYSSLAFAGVLDDVTVVGRPGYSWAYQGDGQATFVVLFPDRRTPGHVDNVGKLYNYSLGLEHNHLFSRETFTKDS